MKSAGRSAIPWSDEYEVHAERSSLNMIGESTKPLGVEPASEIVRMMVHMLFRDCPFELSSICTFFKSTGEDVTVSTIDLLAAHVDRFCY